MIGYSGCNPPEGTLISIVIKREDPHSPLGSTSVGIICYLECEWIGSSPCNIDLTYQPRPLRIDSIIRRMREKEKAGIVNKKKMDEDKCGMWELKCGMNRKANNLR